jgi:hypothetical protein
MIQRRYAGVARRLQPPSEDGKLDAAFRLHEGDD